MSAATKTALDEALAAHLADECEGALLTGYVLQAAGVNLDGAPERTRYLAEYADAQPYHAALGLAHQLVENMQVTWND